MARAAGKRKGRAVQSIAVIGLTVGVGWALLGGAGITIAVLLSILWLAWRFDNDTGSFLLLTVLLMLAFGAIALLLALMAVVF